VAFGTSIGERFHLIGSMQALEINQIRRDPADLVDKGGYFQRWGWVTNPEWFPGAPAGVPQRLTLPNVVSSEHSPSGVIWARNGTNSRSPLIPFALNGMTFTDDGSSVRPFILGDVVAAPNRSGSTKSMSGGPEAVRGNLAFTGGPSGAETINRSFFLGGKYDVTDTFSVYAQGMAGRSESNNRTNRGGFSLQDGWFATVFRENAFLPDEVAAAMDAAGIDSFQLHKLGSFIGSNDIFDEREDRNVFTSVSWSVGFDADLPALPWGGGGGWHARGSWQSGRSDKNSAVHDDLRVDRLFLAMDAVRDPATGAIVCNVQRFNPTPAQLAATPAVQGRLASPGGTPGGSIVRPTTDPLASPIGLDNTVQDCVPFNVMGAGGLSEDAQRYLVTPKIGRSIVTQDFTELLLTGELYEGWGYGPISMAFGGTYRQQDFDDGAFPKSIDVLGPPLNAPELGIRGIPPGFTAGSANLHQFSTVPNVGGKFNVWEAFVELNVPVWESASGNQRLGLDGAFRTSHYSTVEGAVESYKFGADMQLVEDLRVRATYSRDAREANFRELFDQQGGGGAVNDPRFNNTNFQITSVAGGNPNLNPEASSTYVLGGVFTPRWVPGLNFSVDWYETKIAGAISTLGLQRIVDECEIEGVQSLCNQIERDPNTGFIGRIFNTFLNVAKAKVEGIDFETSYRMEPNFFGNQAETLSVRALAGYVLERSDTPLGGVPFDVAGVTNTPEWTGNITTTYGVGPYSFQLQGRFIDSTIINARWVEGVDVDDNSISSMTWWNGQIAYNGETSNGGAWNVALNIQNLFDREPPIQPSFGTRGGAQTTSANYDTFGRRYNLSFNLNF
ncbi:MAG: TonB-dependent receptor, partial [Pseudomonadales bacterium]|nr:TonB-dependent receptor [Pseudomonadales bacterium]